MQHHLNINLPHKLTADLFIWHGGIVAQRLALKVPGSNPKSSLVLPVWHLHILPLSVWVSGGCSALNHSQKLLVCSATSSFGKALLLLITRNVQLQ